MQIQSESAIRHIASLTPMTAARTTSRPCGTVPTRWPPPSVMNSTSGSKRPDRGRRGTTHPPRLRSRDRPGHASPTTGRSSHRRADENRSRCGQHGRDGPAGIVREAGHHPRRERKAAMVSNLLVVLCGETEASPVINTGTLYADRTPKPMASPRPQILSSSSASHRTFGRNSRSGPPTIFAASTVRSSFSSERRSRSGGRRNERIPERSLIFPRRSRRNRNPRNSTRGSHRDGPARPEW